MSEPAVKHRVYVNVPVSRAYALLTSGDGWSRWFTHHAKVEPRPGGQVAFEWVGFGADHVTVSDRGRVTEADENRRFAFTWHPADHPTTVRLTFEKRGDGCVIDLEETGYRFEPQDVAVALDVAAGWGEALTLFKVYAEHGITYGAVPPAE